jgi:hypothetical protein
MKISLPACWHIFEGTIYFRAPPYLTGDELLGREIIKTLRTLLLKAAESLPKKYLRNDA